MPIDKVLSVSIANAAINASAISNTANLVIGALNTGNTVVTGTLIANGSITTNTQFISTAGNNTIQTSAWEKLSVESTGILAKGRIGSDVNGITVSTNVKYSGGWAEDDVDKKKLAYIQHLGNGRHEFRSAANGSGVSWVTSFLFDDQSATFNVPLTISTSGTDRVKVAANGVLTTPYQPLVVATRSGDLTGYNQTSASLVTVFNATELNVGSNYNTSTGIFTAPASGAYAYCASAYTGGPMTMQQVWPVTNGSRGRSSAVVPGSGNDVVVGAGIIYLSTSDSFGVHFYGSNTNATISANFYHTYLQIYFLG